jgi:hypothetical protein
VSFPWDGNYGVILLDWPAPEKTRACAGEPFGERGQATALERFDTVELVSTTEYELVPEPVPTVTLIYEPDSRRFQGVVHRLRAIIRT